VKALWENFFFSPVTMIVDSRLPILFISWRVSMGFGMFWRRVMAKTWSKVWFGKGVWSASARRMAMFGSCFARFFAFLRIFDETSTPTRSLAELATCSKRSPVPQPMSRTSPFWTSFVLFRAAFIFAFCSSEYWMS